MYSSSDGNIYYHQLQCHSKVTYKQQTSFIPLLTDAKGHKQNSVAHIYMNFIFPYKTDRQTDTDLPLNPAQM